MKRALSMSTIALALAACSDATSPNTVDMRPVLMPALSAVPGLNLVVISMSPTTGPTSGGTQVRLNGVFQREIQVGPPPAGCWFCFPQIALVSYSVSFGTTAATVVSVGYNDIDVSPPAHAPGAVSVKVTACIPPGYPVSGCSDVLAPTSYTYLDPNSAPVANAGGPYAANEAATVTLDASASSDPDGDPLAYDWDFGDGTLALNAGATPTHAYADNGTFTATVTVRDDHGHASTATATVAIANVAPVVSAIAGAEILQGETYSGGGSFTDPGADTFTATVDWGDGSTASLALSGKDFTLTHAYANAGSFTVTVAVTDDDGGAGTGNATVTVLSPAGGAQAMADQIPQLIAQGGIPPTLGSPLLSSVDAAAASLASGDAAAARGQIGAFQNKVRAAVKTGKISDAVAASLITFAQRVLASMSP